jgi:endo-1,4-beta-xylanase
LGGSYDEWFVSSVATLGDLAAYLDLDIGFGISNYWLEADEAYKTLVQREATTVATASGLYFKEVHPQEAVYDFTASDVTVSFAEANSMKIRGHNLVWHHLLPEWLAEGNWTKESLEAVLRDHITTIVGHYKGRVHCWDVVNEPFVWDGPELRPTLWCNTIGVEYIKLALQWAHEADPSALLFLNEHSLFSESFGKVSAMCSLVSWLRAQDVPIHGVGMQMHLERVKGQPSPVDPVELRAIMRRFGDLGLLVQVTEMDVRIEDPATEEDLSAQAKIYKDVMQVCADAPNCTSFATWGVSDADSWIPAVYPGWGSALLFDENYESKPAYHSLVGLMGVSHAMASYLSLPGVTGNNATTPDNNAFSPATSLEIFVRAAVDWDSTASGYLVHHLGAGAAGWGLRTQNNPVLVLLLGDGGWTLIPSDDPVLADDDKVWVRVLCTLNDGGNTVTNFYKSSDDTNDPTEVTTWTGIGSDSQAAITPNNAANALEIGDQIGVGSPSTGNFYRVQVKVDGTVVFDADFTVEAPGTTSFTESSAQGATVTVNQSGGSVAEIVEDPFNRWDNYGNPITVRENRVFDTRVRDVGVRKGRAVSTTPANDYD